MSDDPSGVHFSNFDPDTNPALRRAMLDTTQEMHGYVQALIGRFGRDRAMLAVGHVNTETIAAQLKASDCPAFITAGAFLHMRYMLRCWQMSLGIKDEDLVEPRRILSEQMSLVKADLNEAANSTGGKKE